MQYKYWKPRPYYEIYLPDLYTRSTVSLATMLPHLHQSSKVSSNSSDTLMFTLIAPSCVLLFLLALQLTNSVKRFSQTIHSHNIPNGLVVFAYGGEGCAFNEKRTISCVVLCIFRISIHWLAKTQPASASHSKDSEVLTLYLSTKMFEWLCPTLQNLGFQVSDAPTTIYE